MSTETMPVEVVAMIELATDPSVDERDRRHLWIALRSLAGVTVNIPTDHPVYDIVKRYL